MSRMPGRSRGGGAGSAGGGSGEASDAGKGFAKASVKREMAERFTAPRSRSRTTMSRRKEMQMKSPE